MQTNLRQMMKVQNKRKRDPNESTLNRSPKLSKALMGLLCDRMTSMMDMNMLIAKYTKKDL